MWISLLIMIAMGLYPPWIHTLDLDGLHYEKAGDYAFLFSPPESKPFHIPFKHLRYKYDTAGARAIAEFVAENGKPIRGRTGDLGEIDSTAVFLDFKRLVIQWFCMILLLTGSIISLARKKS